MNRRNFIGALAIAPLLVKEALATKKPSWWNYNGMNPDFAYPYELGPGWLVVYSAGHFLLCPIKNKSRFIKNK